MFIFVRFLGVNNTLEWVRFYNVWIFFKGDGEISPNILNRRFSDDLHELSAICLFRDAYERPCASEVLTHPLFKTLKKTLPLPELLKPAMPLSDRVGYDTGKDNMFLSASHFFIVLIDHR